MAGELIKLKKVAKSESKSKIDFGFCSGFITESNGVFTINIIGELNWR